ncbi:MAG: hypothetical protein HY699_15120 [Deltaproteobacteria bacterium]|nr:hypothetical protein [Deltaproteobacteria bacterium]
MKRLTVTLLLALALSSPATAAWAEGQPLPQSDDYDDSQAHPLRIAGYLLHPIGYTFEWLLFRPIHRLVSQPGLAQVFGHRAHGDDAAVGAR